MPKHPPKPAPAFTLRPGESITFVLPVVPRTKKNHREHIKRRAKSGKLITVPIPGGAYREMEALIKKEASLAMVRLERWVAVAWLNLAQALNCAAIFYRDANRGDANGYYQGLADALEAAGVLADDRWLVQWDGSRLRKDKDRPRIEVTLTAVSDGKR